MGVLCEASVFERHFFNFRCEWNERQKRVCEAPISVHFYPHPDLLVIDECLEMLMRCSQIEDGPRVQMFANCNNDFSRHGKELQR